MFACGWKNLNLWYFCMKKKFIEEMTKIQKIWDLVLICKSRNLIRNYSISESISNRQQLSLIGSAHILDGLCEAFNWYLNLRNTICEDLQRELQIIKPKFSHTRHHHALVRRIYTFYNTRIHITHYYWLIKSNIMYNI